VGDPRTGGVLGPVRMAERAPLPGSSRQLDFLRRLQRLLSEGQFTATYKFALIHALADRAVQHGDDSGDPLFLPLPSIAERFIELYWRQVAPWPGVDARTGDPPVLAQNTGNQAAVVGLVREARAAYSDRIDRMRAQDVPWTQLRASVATTIRRMPLWRLQKVGGGEPDTFLYPHELKREGDVQGIVLRPGVGYCLRAFHPLVVDLAQGAWTRFIRRRNPTVLGERTDLAEFLFGAPRNTLEAVRAPLLELQEGACFYCGSRVGGASHVDHFVPWSRYPVDLGHNFVVAHDRCNGAKSDHLPAPIHLERWEGRNERFEYDLRGIFERGGTPHDIAVSKRVATWAYRQVADRNGFVWEKGRVLVPLDAGWEEILRTG
jgi:hypothetical protein